MTKELNRRNGNMVTNRSYTKTSEGNTENTPTKSTGD